MDIDFQALAPQLRNPTGDAGREVGKQMVEWNGSANAFAIDCLKVQPTDHILEIGFGPGEALAEVVRLTPTGFVAGLDQSETMLEMAKERNSRAIIQDRLELSLGTADKMPYEDGAFDAVFAVNVGHFWSDPLVELAECKRVLLEGGRLVLFFTQPDNWPEGLRNSGVFHARSPAQIQELYRKAGFRNVRMETRQLTFGECFCILGEK